MSNPPLRALFEPESAAIVGIGSAGVELARRWYEAIRGGGYKAPLRLVEDVTGDRHPALPPRVELVAIAGPAGRARELLHQCGEQGVKIALLLPWREATSPADLARLKAEVLELRRRHGLRVVGPDCAAILRASSSWNAGLGHGIAHAGSLALVSQSGSLSSAIMDWAQAREIGFSTVASLGTALDVGIGEVLDYLALDPETRAVLLYLERVDHARHFMSGLRALARIKPVLVVRGARHGAAADEPSPRATPQAVFDAALRRAGAVQVASLPELFSTAELLSQPPRFWGERLAIVTNSAGLGALAADRARDRALPLAVFSAASQPQGPQLDGCAEPLANPLDLLDEATPAQYAQALERCLGDPAIDGILVLHAAVPPIDPCEIAAALAAVEPRRVKPVLTCFMGGARVERARPIAVAAGLPAFEAPETAIDAFARLAAYRRNQELLVQAPDVFSSDELDIEGARLIIEAALARGRSALSQLEAKAILRAFRIEVSPAVRARDADEALVAAQQLGFPVVLKIDSPEIAHKSKVDGIRLNLTSAVQVRSVYRELTEGVARRRPDATIAGVIVEPMLDREARTAFFAGASRDTGFGPVIMLSPAGSALAPAIGLPPLNTRLARQLFVESGLALDALPEGAADRLKQLLLRLSDLVCELPEVRALEIDPLIVDGAAAVALDARIEIQHVPASQARYSHLAMAPYPRRLIEHVQLPDGTPITLRPIRPEDAAMEQDFVRNLSLESRRFRFMSGLARLSPDLLIRFTQLDYDRELALLAVRRVDDVDEEVGVARYVADGDELGCEFAVVVADAWQKRGVASQLMRALIAAARERHFTHMHGDVLADNTRMLRWMSRLGFVLSAHPDDPGVRVVTLQLSAAL